MYPINNKSSIPEKTIDNLPVEVKEHILCQCHSIRHMVHFTFTSKDNYLLFPCVIRVLSQKIKPFPLSYYAYFRPLEGESSENFINLIKERNKEILNNNVRNLEIDKSIPEIYDTLRKFQHLETLRISIQDGKGVNETVFHDIFGACLKKNSENLTCFPLKKLDCSYQPLNDTHLFYLSLFPNNLEILNFSWNDVITDASVQRVAQNCEKLNTLILKNCRNISSESLPNILSLSSLVELNLKGCSLEEHVNLEKSTPTALSSANLRKTDISPSNLVSLVSHASNLQQLDISGNELSNSTLNALFKNCRTLTALRLGELNGQGEILESPYPSLSRLEILATETDLTYNLLSPILRHLPNLQVCVTLNVVDDEIKEVYSYVNFKDYNKIDSNLLFPDLPEEEFLLPEDEFLEEGSSDSDMSTDTDDSNLNNMRSQFLRASLESTFYNPNFPRSQDFMDTDN